MPVVQLIDSQFADSSALLQTRPGETVYVRLVVGEDGLIECVKFKAFSESLYGKYAGHFLFFGKVSSFRQLTRACGSLRQ